MDIYFQKQKYNDDWYNKDRFYLNCPVLYSSSVIKNVDNEFTSIYTPTYLIPVIDKIIIDKNMVQIASGNKDKTYLLSLKGKDSSGKRFRITNYAISEFPFGIMKDDVSKNIFIISQMG